MVIHSCSRTANDIGWYNQPVFSLAVGSIPAAIGERLKQALIASVWDSREDDSALTPHPVVIEAGCKSWEALERQSRLVTIETDKHTITLMPNRAAGRGEGRGFITIANEAVKIPWNEDDSSIGKIVLSAFAIATSARR